MSAVSVPARSDVAEAIAAEAPVLTIKEAAAILRVHPATAKRWAAEGKLPGALPKVGRTWRVHAPTLLAFLRSGVAADVHVTDHTTSRA